MIHLDSGNLGGSPFNLSQGWQASGGLHEPVWQPGVVCQGRASIWVQAKNSPIKSYTSRLWSVPMSIASYKSFLKKLINMEVASFDNFMLLGLT